MTVINKWNYISWIVLVLLANQTYGYRQRLQVTYHYEDYDTAETHTEPPKISRRVDSPQQRMNERSIPFNSEVQRIQDQESRRTQSSDNEPVSRAENVSYKRIVNFKSRNSTLLSRTGQADQSKVFNDGKVLFRDSSSSFVPQITEDCLKIGICENIPDYPEEQVEMVVKQLGASAANIFKVDALDQPEIAQRIGQPDELELCEFSERIITPKAAQDQTGKWKYILNQPQATQGFRMEVCKQKETECSSNAYFYGDWAGYCKQKFTWRPMAAMDENGNMIYDSFRIPSCCSCVLTRRLTRR